MSLLWESSQVCVYIYSIFACLRQADGKQSDVIFTTTETTMTTGRAGRTGATVYVTRWHTTVTTRLLLPTHFPRKLKETSRQLVNFSQVIILWKLNIYMNCKGNCRLHPLWTDKPWLWKIYAERPEKIAFDEIIERFLFRQLVWYVPPQWNVLVSVPKFVERSRIRENDPWLCRCGEMDNLRSASVHFFFHRRRVHVIIIFLKGILLKVV